jgi:hypothetical protein
MQRRLEEGLALRVGVNTGEVVTGAAVLAIIGTPADIEQAFAPPKSYVEPFAHRALGVAREDDALVAHADALFRALGLDWHADQTVRLAELRKIAHT